MTQKKNRPDKVSNAVSMLWIVIALGILHIILYYLNVIQIEALNEVSPSLILFNNLFSLAFIAFFIYKIGEGRNWARITFLILFIAGIPMSIPIILPQWSASPISGVFGIGGIILQIVALMFLFQKQSSKWFKSR
jgi:hypothetical protein